MPRVISGSARGIKLDVFQIASKYASNLKRFVILFTKGT